MAIRRSELGPACWPGTFGRRRLSGRSESCAFFRWPQLSARHAHARRGEEWTYETPPSHEVGWLAVSYGSVFGEGTFNAGDMIAFDKSDAAIPLQGGVTFVPGSAVSHLYGLVLGYCSVHTSEKTLAPARHVSSRCGISMRETSMLAFPAPKPGNADGYDPSDISCHCALRVAHAKL